ncbi:MAG: UDP-glucose 4-epimerase GalE [Roseivivax sp.]|nr:UDP-glucose 4-epimerase GalE [Roseivivax sp.]
MGGKTPTVLLTGVAGYIGSHTALAFLDAGWHVIGVDDLSTGSRSAVPEGVEFIEEDCRSAALRNRLAGRKIDAAVHFAALIRVDQSVSQPVEYYEANFCMLGHFLKSAQVLGIPAIVFSSTAAVYGDQGDAAISETAPTLPSSPYGRSKLAAEWMLSDFCKASGMRHVTLRYFNVAGGDGEGRAGPRADATHLIKVVSEAATGQRDLVRINGDDYDTPDGTCVRDYIHVSDLADVHVAAVKHLVNGGKSVTLNCGYGHGFSVREVIERALALSDRPFPVELGERRPGDTVFVVADNAKLLRTLDWRPQHDDLDGILRSAIEWEHVLIARRAAEQGAAPSGTKARKQPLRT